MARLFVAVWPPDDVVAELAALPRPAEPGVRWTPPESWHVTLRFFGEADPDACVAALRRLPLPSGPAMARLGPAVSRLGRSVICVPCAGLDELAAAVVDLTAAVGRPPEPRPFAGHITLARLAARGACRLAGHRLAAAFPVREVTLVASTAQGTGREGAPGGGAGGSRYEVVERVEIPEGP